MSVRTSKKAANDPSRFEGEGISFRAKLIGIDDVKDARGDQMCQEALVKLKNSARIAGGHKRKITINVNLEGVKITDAISLIALHSHPVHQISFISRDPTDNRAFGYICGTEDGLHKFFGIKTATAAEQLINALKDLFQVVFENKKKAEDSSKEKPDQHESGGDQTPKDEAIPENSQAPAVVTSSDTENTDQVTGESTNPQVQSEPVANLLDLEDMADNILKGIEQVNTLEFDFLTNDTPSSPSPTVSSPGGQVSPAVTVDPWGLSSTETPAKPDASSSSLGDLAGLQTGPFSTSFPLQTGFGGSTSFNTSPAGLHVSQNPFGNDPFSSFGKPPAAPAFGATNPFGAEFSPTFPTQVTPLRMGAYGMMPGVAPHAPMSPPSIFVGLQAGNPFADGDSTLLQTGNGSDAAKARSKSPDNDLFSDLLDIKKSSAVKAKSPKDMFVQANAPEKKSMNALMTSGASPRASPVPTMQMKPGISPRNSPVPTMFMQPEVPARASPVPTMQMKSGLSPRDSPVPSFQMKPGISPRNSPVPSMFMQPEIPLRASPVSPTPLVMQPVISPQGSASTTPTKATESIPFDVFGAAVGQTSDTSLLD
jgi:hypothetical protein